MKRIMILILAMVILTSCANVDEKSQLLTYEEEIESLEMKLLNSQSINEKMEAQLNELQGFIDEQNIKIMEFESSIEKLENENSIIESDTQVVPYINNWKYPPESGLMRYVGNIGIRAIPSNDSTIIFPKDRLENDNDIVMCTAVIAIGQMNDGPKWGVVLKNEYGIIISGYVPYDELELIERPVNDYVESLGGFHLGDRIEKLVGTIDRDYKIISENLCMYTFPEENFGPGEPFMQVMNDVKTIDAFVTDDFRVYYLRTDSSRYELSSGYKVGDNANEVIEFYSNKYEESNLHPMESWGDYEYKLSDNENITFGIDTLELNDDSKISVIMLH